jgi:ABC-type Mn2+/Zn2+ transport system permease subunit
MSSVLPSLITSAGLIGGFQSARATGVRAVGGVVLAAAGAAAFGLWKRDAGTVPAAALTGLYLAAFGLSHPLAKKIGPWPSVYTVTGATALASLLFGRRRDHSGASIGPVWGHSS